MEYKKKRKKKNIRGRHISFSILVSHLSAVSKYYPATRAIRAIAHFNDYVFRLIKKQVCCPQISRSSDYLIPCKLQDLAREKGAGNAHDGSKWGVGK